MSQPNCPGSGTVQRLSWFPDSTGYPGAALCIHCSGGILVLKNRVFKDAEGYPCGPMRVHKPVRPLSPSELEPEDQGFWT